VLTKIARKIHIQLDACGFLWKYPMSEFVNEQCVWTVDTFCRTLYKFVVNPLSLPV